MRPNGSAEVLEFRRQLGVQQVKSGKYTIQEVADFLDVDESSVRRWVQEFDRFGASGLKARAVPGRPHKLTRTQEKIVARWLRLNPRELGFPTELWSASRLASLIYQEFGIHFSADHLTCWLRDHGFTPQRPERVPRERDFKAISAWIKKDWERIKKKRPKSRHTSP